MRELGVDAGAVDDDVYASKGEFDLLSRRGDRLFFADVDNYVVSVDAFQLQLSYCRGGSICISSADQDLEIAVCEHARDLVAVPFVCTGYKNNSAHASLQGCGLIF